MATQKSSFKLHLPGFRELRRSERVWAELERRARRVAGAAGPGFEARRAPGANRARVVVVPTTSEARKANAASYAVLRALSAGAG